MIQSAEEVEIMEHVSSACKCLFNAQLCTKCQQTKSGFVATRSDALSRMISVGYVTYDRSKGGFIVTPEGKERWARMSGVMNKITSSAGVVRPPTTTAEQDEQFFEFR